MRKATVYRLRAVLPTFLAGSLAWWNSGATGPLVTAQTPKTNQQDANSAAPPERIAISNYRAWKPVNSKPIVVPPKTRTLCAPQSAVREENPHESGAINVYVNEIGRKNYLQDKSGAFAEGTVIIKEKLRPITDESQRPKDDEPIELGVMIKRQKGFDFDAGDWQFLFVDARGQVVTERREVANCRSCHMLKAGSDFVYRRH